MSLERNFQSAKDSFEERILPIQIGWNLSVEKIDTFFERQDTRGYKFDIDSKGNIFIVEMEKAEHASVVGLLQKYFEVPNGGIIINPPIDVLGASAHYKPRGRGKPSAPDIAIYPSLSIIPKPPTPAPPPQFGLRILRAPRIPSRHREIPPVDKTGRPHARIMCEVAVSQKYDGPRGWNAKCCRWMRQQYVRCVFGIKIYNKSSTRNANGQFDRCMIARLWTRQVTPIPGRHIAVAGQPGVYYEEWDFGTHGYYTGVLTACTGPGLLNYQVNIPNQDVFWNPPVIGGAPLHS
ncbi:13380_t:CDS:2 [Funneliformis caledonium]|uniref:13380_t:CDS:1 n=1 Tax=Funneliformis caledonium TaxID=1117310 RepID=A0A9N9CKT9_9GLOM|nr:13380_t:CDS:2 [Funneliformis caledonium]